MVSPSFPKIPPVKISQKAAVSRNLFRCFPIKLHNLPARKAEELHVDLMPEFFIRKYVSFYIIVSSRKASARLTFSIFFPPR